MPQPRDNVKFVVCPVFGHLGRKELLERHPKLYIAARIAEVSGHDAHDLIRQIVEPDGPLQDIACLCIAALPEAVADYCDARRTRPILFGTEAAADDGLHSERLKQARGEDRGLHALGPKVAVGAQIECEASPPSHALTAGSLCPPIEKIAERDNIA